MPDALTRSERAAIEAFRGKVTKCPPKTFALDATVTVTMRQSSNTGWKNWQRGERFKKAERKAGKKPKQRIPRDEQRVRFAEHASPDRTADDVARLVGVHPKTARNMLAMFGLPYLKRPAGQRKPDPKREAMYRDLAARMTAPEMAAHLKLHPSTVRSNLSHLKLTALPARKQRESAE